MMSSLEEFKKIIANNKYFFHFHTNLTDGEISIEKLMSILKKNEIKVVITCEHIRKEPTFNFNNFLEEIHTFSKKYKIKSIIGVETKILPSGELDISKEILEYVDVLGIAVHSFPNDIELYRKTLKSVFSNSLYKNKILIWVHPGRFLKRRNFLQTEKGKKIFKELLEIAIFNEILIEFNHRAKLPPKEFLENINKDNIILGCDSHTYNDVYSCLSSLKKKFINEK